MATPEVVAIPRRMIVRRHAGVALPRAIQRPELRFHWEFWLICLIVSVGLVESLPIGFYKFRLTDLILDLSLLYGVILMVKRHLSRPSMFLLLAQALWLVWQCLLEGASVTNLTSLRTLLGVGAIYLTPFVFFVVRESAVDRRKILLLLIVSWLICLASQAGILPRGEAYADGAVDLASIFHISRGSFWELDYQETTITVWRALSAAVTIAVILSSAGLWMKGLGAVAACLQFAGGGGGRSQLLFLFCVPLLLYLRPTSARPAPRLRRVLVAAVVSVSLAAFYLWSPIGGAGPVKGEYSITHFDRVTEVFVPFLRGWNALTDNPALLNARGVGYQEYWEGIISSPRVFFLGVGLAEGAGFKDTPNVLAHNMVLDVWALAGLIGLFFFLSFIAYVARDLWALLKVTPDRGEIQVLGFTVATAVIYMFQWLLFQAAVADRSFMIVFYLLAGLLRPTARWIEARRVSGEISSSSLGHGSGTTGSWGRTASTHKR